MKVTTLTIVGLAAVVLAFGIGAFWLIYLLLPLPLFIADIALALPIAAWWNVRAYRGSRD